SPVPLAPRGAGPPRRLRSRSTGLEAGIPAVRRDRTALWRSFLLHLLPPALYAARTPVSLPRRRVGDRLPARGRHGARRGRPPGPRRVHRSAAWLGGADGQPRSRHAVPRRRRRPQGSVRIRRDHPRGPAHTGPVAPIAGAAVSVAGIREATRPRGDSG